MILNVLQNIEEALLNQPPVGGQDPARAYTELLLTETPMEIEWRNKVQNDQDLSDEEKRKELERLEQCFYFRRTINDTYFMQLKSLILSRNYI